MLIRKISRGCINMIISETILWGDTSAKEVILLYIIAAGILSPTPG